MDCNLYTSDFKKAILKILEEQFPEVTPIGCYFHWKQALRRYMIRA
jgi:hypothetical protein